MKLKKSSLARLVLAVLLLLIGAILGSILTVTFFPQLSSTPTTFLEWIHGTKTLREKEPNNTFTTATPISIGYETTGAISTKDDVDIYVFRLTAPARVRIELRSVPYRYEMKIYDGTYQLVASSSRMGFDESSSILTIPNVGAYYIQIRQLGKNTLLSPPYTITVNVLAPGE